MSKDFNNDLIQRFLTNINRNSDSNDTNKQQRKSLQEIETEALGKMLSGHNTGEPSEEIPPGDRLERLASLPSVENIIEKHPLPEMVHDTPYGYNQRVSLQDALETPEPDPVDELLVNLFFISSMDIIWETNRYMVGREKLENKNFTDLESVAETILKKRGQNYTSEDINKLAKELILLNSNGDETDLDSMVEHALENINKGYARYIDRDFNITDDGSMAKRLKSLGFEPTEENMHIYQMIHLFEKDMADGTYFEIDKQVKEIFRKFHEGKKQNVDKLYEELKEELGKYQGSPLAERLLNHIELLKSNKIKDTEQWDNIIGDLTDYRKQQSDVQELFRKCTFNEISLNQLKESMLTQYGINMYSKEEQDKAREIQLQYSMANLLSNIYNYRSSSHQLSYDKNGIFYDFYNTAMESADVVANILGGDIYTNAEYIQSLKENSEFWENCSPDKMSYDQFKQVFQKIYGTEFDEEAVIDLMEYLEYNPGLDIINDDHKEFLDKFEAVFGKDFAEEIFRDRAKLNTDRIASLVGNIAMLVFAMKYIAGSSFIKGVSFDSSAFYRALGLSGKGLQLATGMTVGGTTFATYTFATQSLDNVIMQRGLDDWKKLPGQVGESFAFGAYAAAVNILLISPLTAPQYEKGLKAAQELIDGSNGAVSGKEFERVLLEAQAPVIKSDLGKFVYSTAVNTTAFTVYGMGGDLIRNGIDPLMDGNAGKYIGELALANLQNILTYEGIQLLIGGTIAGQAGADAAREMTTEEILQYFESLDNFTIEKTVISKDMIYEQAQLNGAESAGKHLLTDYAQETLSIMLPDGSVVEFDLNARMNPSNGGNLLDNCQEVYILNFPNGRVAVSSIQEVYALTVAVMMREVQLKNAIVDMTVDNIQASTTRLQSGSPRLQTVNPLSDAPETQQPSASQTGQNSTELTTTSPNSPAKSGGNTSLVQPEAPHTPEFTPTSIPGQNVPVDECAPNFDNPQSTYTRTVSPNPQSQSERPNANPRRPQTMYKERIRVVLQDLKTMGADGQIIDNIETMVESDNGSNLPALAEVLNDIAEQGKQQNSTQSGQALSEPLVILNGIFNCPPEYIPAKAEAYMFAKVQHLDEERTLELINWTSDKFDVCIFANLSFTVEEADARYQDALNRIEDERLKNIAVKMYAEVDDGEFKALEIEDDITRYLNEYAQLMAEINKLEDENLRKNLLAVLDAGFKKYDELSSFEIEVMRPIVYLLGLKGFRFYDEDKPSETFLRDIKRNALNGEDIYKALTDTRFKKDATTRETTIDMYNMDKYNTTIQLCTIAPNSQTAAIEYERYLDEILAARPPKIAEQIKKLCLQIEHDFGVRVFLSANQKEAGVALKLIYAELANYKMRAQNAGETANIPPVLNLMTADTKYFAKKNNPGHTAGGYYNRNNNTISLNGMTIQRIKSTLRHELMHANDTRGNENPDFPPGFDPARFIGDLLEAGLTDSEIEYALTNRKEFIAVAAQGNMNKYSSYFKQQLVMLGMPEWAVDMSRHEPILKTYSRHQKLLMELMLTSDYYLLHPELAPKPEEGEVDGEEELSPEAKAWLAEMLFGGTASKDDGISMQMEPKSVMGAKEGPDFIDDNSLLLNLYKREIMDNIAVLRGMGVDEQILDAIREQAENGSEDQLAALSKVLTDTIVAGKILPSNALILLDSIFGEVMPEDIPEKIKAYNTAKSRGLSIQDIIELINSKEPNGNIHDIISKIDAGIEITEEETEELKQYAENIIEGMKNYCNDYHIERMEKNGYLSSPAGYKAFYYVVSNFDLVGHNGTIPYAMIIMTDLKPEEALKIKERNLDTQMDIGKLCDLARLTDEEYERLMQSPYADILSYVSDIEEVNELFVYVSHNEEYNYQKSFRAIDRKIHEEINSNPQNKEEILKFYRQLIKDMEYDLSMTVKHLEDEPYMQKYRKALEYMHSLGVEDARIVFMDINDDNVYNAGNINDLWGKKAKYDWDVFVFDKDGNFIRRSIGTGTSATSYSIPETIVTPDIHTDYLAETLTIVICEHPERVLKDFRKEVKENGELLYTEIYKKAENEDKCFVYREYPDGNIFRVGMVYMEKPNELIYDGVRPYLNHGKVKAVVLKDSRKEVRDKEGNLIYTEIYEKIEGLNKYNIFREYPDGSRYAEGLAYINEANEIIIEKTLHHENGNITNYVYLSSPDGTKLSFSQISDGEGNILFEHSFRFKVIDENHFVSIEDGVEYDIQYHQFSVEVKCSDGRKVVIPIGSNNENSFGVLSRDLLPILKQLPGSIYFAIQEYGLKKIGYEIDNVEENNAHYNENNNVISISTGKKDSLFVLLHELGHYLDHFNYISTNQDVIDTYMEERRALTQMQPNYENQSLHYFINSLTRRTDSIEGSIQEIVAEINALLYAQNISPEIEMRSQFLQAYFPKTFALVSQMLLNNGTNTVMMPTLNQAAAQVNSGSSSVMSAEESPEEITQPAELQHDVSSVTEKFAQMFPAAVNPEALKELIESGKVDPEICEALVNDTELQIYLKDIPAFDAELIPSVIKAYKYGTEQGFEKIAVKNLIHYAVSGKSIDYLISDLEMEKAVVEAVDVEFFDNPFYANQMKATLRGALRTNFKDPMQPILDNPDLLHLMIKYSYCIDCINEDNISVLRLCDEYTEKTGGRTMSYTGTILTCGEKYMQEYIQQMEEDIAAYERALKNLENNEMISKEDFFALLLAQNQVRFDANADTDERFGYCQKFADIFADGNGNVPAYALEFVQQVIDEISYIGDAYRNVLKVLTTNPVTKEHQTLSKKDMQDILEIVRIIKESGESYPYNYVSLARNENGEISADLVLELLRKGFSIEIIKELYRSYNYHFSDPETVLELYNIALNVMNYTAELDSDVIDEISLSIFNTKDFLASYSSEAKNIIENYNAFMANPEKLTEFVQKAVADGALNPDNFWTDSVDVKLITDTYMKAYDLIPKDFWEDPYNSGLMLELLGIVNEMNYELFELCIKHAGKIKISPLKEIMEKCDTPEKAQMMASAFEIIKDGDGKVDLYSLPDFYENLIEVRPDIMQELIDNNVHLDLSRDSITNLVRLIEGKSYNSNGTEQDLAPLNDEQRQFLYQMMQYRTNYGSLRIHMDDTSSRLIRDLDPKYYSLVKLFLDSNNSKDFDEIAREIYAMQTAPDSAEKFKKLEKILRENPDIIKTFSLEAIVNHYDSVALLMKHPDLIESFNSGFNTPLTFVVEYASIQDIEKGLEAIEKIPDNIKQVFPKSLADVFIVAIIGNTTTINITLEEYIEFLEQISHYDQGIRDVLENASQYALLTLKKCPQTTLDFAADYIKSFSNINDVDDRYINKMLSCTDDLYKKQETLNEILSEKDNILKQIKIRCKDMSPEILDIIMPIMEDIFDDADNVKYLIFVTNLTKNNLIEYLYDTAKLIECVNKKPQDYINGEVDEKIINALIDYRKKDSERSLYNSLSPDDQNKVEELAQGLKVFSSQYTLPMIEAISTTDIETVKLLLDKRFSIFREEIAEVNTIGEEEKRIASDLIRNAKRIDKNGNPVKLTGRQKIEMLNITKGLKYLNEFDLEKYKTPLKKGTYILDIERLRKDYINAILLKNGLTEEQIKELKPENMRWNEQYLYLLAFKPAKDEGELADLIREASLGNFETYISDPTNKYGQANLATERAFAERHLSFDQYQHPDIEDHELEIDGKKYTIGLWSRDPQEDLFMGSKTSCCTALNGCNGGATANYILNKSINVIFLRDPKGNVVGMARVYMVMTDGKPSLVLDNIELNQAYKHGSGGLDMLETIRDGFFRYAHAYAQSVTGNPDTPVYFSTSYTNVPVSDLETVTQMVEFIGSISREDIYINAKKSWINPQILGITSEVDFYEVPDDIETTTGD